MKYLLLVLLLIVGDSYSQTKEYIDSLNILHATNIENYESCLYKKVEQDGRVDSIWFYLNNDNQVVFIYSKHYQGSDHNAEDWAFDELLLDSGKVLFRRSWGYLDEHLHKPNPTNAMITVSESLRSYYKYSGENILCYEKRSVEGPYLSRDSLLNTVPLKSKTGWLDCSDRVDWLIEEEYLNTFKQHCRVK